MSNFQELKELCANKLIELKIEDKRFFDRLQEELKQVDLQGDIDYFLDLKKNATKYPKNEHNSLVPFLLGIVDEFNIDQEFSYVISDWPDVDIDIFDECRDYLKNIWAPTTFGERNVCNISNYNTFKIKASLLDMARVHDDDHGEIQAITKKMGLKDDEGDDLTWDKALEIFPEFKEYCEKHPDSTNSAKRLLYRIRGRSKHAGGLVISKTPVDEFVPLIIDNNGNPASAWTEGQASQELTPVGLVKIDWLVVTDLTRIIQCCELIKKRHNLPSICARPGMEDWSDDSYLEDSQALALLDAGKGKGIFQFDGLGICSLCKRARIKRFADIPAVSALYRPGPLQSGVVDEYCRRKNGESYNVHPLIGEILKETYGVIVYQEQVMKILNVVGGIPLTHCEVVRKAISKKKGDVFLKYESIFSENGRKNLGASQEFIKELWEQMATFGSYAFNKSHAVAYAHISSRLLWLKAHYPLEFYTTTLQNEKDNEKIRTYKTDAEKIGIKVNRLNLNHSKINFEIHNEEILVGFSNVKGIGTTAAERIVANQPYTSFEDFLTRFGTDAGVVKPLVSFGLFCEVEKRRKYWEFYEHFTNENRKKDASQKRHDLTNQKRLEDIKSHLPEKIRGLVDSNFVSLFLDCMLERDFWAKIDTTPELEPFRDLELDGVWPIIKKYRRSVLQFQGKELTKPTNTLATFVSTKGSKDEKMEALLGLETEFAEEAFYGFAWEHPLTKSPDYDPKKTFEQFELDSHLSVAPVQIQIISKIKQKKAKNGKPYYDIEVQDSNYQREFLRIWDNDYNLFKNEFCKWDDILKGNMLSLKLTRPVGTFRNYTLERGNFFAKEADGRVLLMRSAPRDLTSQQEDMVLANL